MDAWLVAVGILIGTLSMTVVPAVFEWARDRAWPWLRWWLSRPTIDTVGDWSTFRDLLVKWEQRRP